MVSRSSAKALVRFLSRGAGERVHGDEPDADAHHTGDDLADRSSGPG